MDRNTRLVSWGGVVMVALCIFVAEIIVVLSRAFYNLFLHPLSRFPGPKSWIAFPMLKSLAQVRGQLDFQIREFHEYYGSVIRCGPNELSFTSSAAWKDIYGHGHSELPKFFPSGIGARDAGTSNIISSNAADHFRFRRAMLPAFSDRALEQQEGIIRGYVDLLVTRLREIASSEQPTDMKKWYTFTTFDLIGDLAYGTSFDGLHSGKQNPWVQNIENMLRLFPILALAKSSPLIAKLFLFFASDKIKNSRQEHLRLTTELALARIEKKDIERRGDFMDFIMRARGKEHGLSDAEIVSNTDTLIVAGSETTATLLCGVTYYLLQNPAARDQCVDEVRSAFACDEEITFKAASAKLPFMLACLDEALRLFPPVPTVLFRTTLPGQVTVIGGHEVPGNTCVGVHHLAISHSENNFHDARGFHPERWLSHESSSPVSPFHSDLKGAFNPFSIGPRNCIGRNLAYHEMRLILAKILFNFDLVLQPECKHWAESQRIFALWEKPPLLVKVTVRT